MTDSDRSEPTTSEPTKSEPTKSEPTKSEPTKSEPTKSEPTKSEPAKSEPAARRRKSRRWQFRLLIFLLFLLLLALLLWRQNCLPGRGGGGPASSDGSGMAARSGGGSDQARGETCTLRVDASGISVAGKPVPSPEAAVTACGAAKRAHLNVTGDAVFGTVEKLEEALQGKGITVQRQK